MPQTGRIFERMRRIDLQAAFNSNLRLVRPSLCSAPTGAGYIEVRVQMRFAGFFFLFIFPGCDRRICLGISGRLPRKSKCAGYEPCAHCQPKRIQGNWQYAIQADAATQRS